MNDHVVALAVNEVGFPFCVVEGRLRVESLDGSHCVPGPNDTLLIPSCTVHRTVPQGRVVNPLVERVDTDTVFYEEGQKPPSEGG